MKAPLSQDDVRALLATIPDPEFGLSILDLGLIYDIRTNGPDVHVAMTLTSTGCPAGSMMLDGVRAALQAIEGIGNVDVQLVWEPAWTPEMLSADARVQLGWDGADAGPRDDELR